MNPFVIPDHWSVRELRDQSQYPDTTSMLYPNRSRINSLKFQSKSDKVFDTALSYINGRPCGFRHDPSSHISANIRHQLTMNIECDASRLETTDARISTVAGVDASVVGVVHLERDDAPGHAVLHLCAGGQLCVVPVPGERGRRVAAL